MLPNKCVLKIGDKFNFLTVIGYNSERKMYICKCDCGNTVEVRIWNLKYGRNKSCGCKKNFFKAQKVLESDFSSLKHAVYTHYKYQAIRRGYKFNLSKEEFLNITNKNCEYCGAEPNLCFTGYDRKGTGVVDYTQYKYNGVDRVDNTLGYTIENSVPCCKICNNSKATLTKEDWLAWIEQVHKYNFDK